MLDESETNAVVPRCLILAHPDADAKDAIARDLRRLGWDLYDARSGPEVRRLARLLDADIAVLNTELPGESGWLTCDKLTREQPSVKVILVSSNLSPRNQELAAFVGARALVAPDDGVAAVVETLLGPAVHAAS